MEAFISSSVPTYTRQTPDRQLSPAHYLARHRHWKPVSSYRAGADPPRFTRWEAGVTVVRTLVSSIYLYVSVLSPGQLRASKRNPVPFKDLRTTLAKSLSSSSWPPPTLPPLAYTLETTASPQPSSPQFCRPPRSGRRSHALRTAPAAA